MWLNKMYVMLIKYELNSNDECEEKQETGMIVRIIVWWRIITNDVVVDVIIIITFIKFGKYKKEKIRIYHNILKWKFKHQL